MNIVLTGNTTFKLANFRQGLIRRLIAEGHRVIILAPEDDYVAEVRALGCDHVSLDMDRNGTSPPAEAKLLAEIYRKLKRLKPDLVFSYTIKNNIYCGLACRGLRIPFVPNVTGLGPTFNSQGALNLLVRSLYRIAFKKARTVFFQNSNDLEIFESSGLVPKDRVKLLPGSGVDLKRFVETPLPDETDGIRFLLVARMLWDKGVGDYVSAARQVRIEYPNARFQLLGPLDPDSKSGIGEEQINEWVEDGIVEYLGATRDVLPFLSDAHCIVLPSYYREGTPRSLLEAGAVGRPIITTDMPGCRDVVIDEQSGYLVQPRNPMNLAQAVEAFLKLEEVEKAEMAKASARHIATLFDEEIVIDAYIENIAQVASASTRSMGLQKA